MTQQDDSVVSGQLLYRLGALQSSMDSIIARFDRLDRQNKENELAHKVEIELLKARADTIERKILTHETRVYSIAGLISIVIPFFFNLFKQKLGF